MVDAAAGRGDQLFTQLERGSDQLVRGGRDATAPVRRPRAPLSLLPLFPLPSPRGRPEAGETKFSMYKTSWSPGQDGTPGAQLGPGF